MILNTILFCITVIFRLTIVQKTWHFFLQQKYHKVILIHNPLFLPQSELYLPGWTVEFLAVKERLIDLWGFFHKRRRVHLDELDGVVERWDKLAIKNSMNLSLSLLLALLEKVWLAQGYFTILALPHQWRWLFLSVLGVIFIFCHGLNMPHIIRNNQRFIFLHWSHPLHSPWRIHNLINKLETFLRLCLRSFILFY